MRERFGELGRLRGLRDRILDEFRRIPQPVLQTRTLEALGYLERSGIAKADSGEIAKAIDKRYQPDNWRDGTRPGNVGKALRQLEERGSVFHELILVPPDADHGGSTSRLVYGRTEEPQTSPQQ